MEALVDQVKQFNSVMVLEEDFDWQQHKKYLMPLKYKQVLEFLGLLESKSRVVEVLEECS